MPRWRLHSSRMPGPCHRVESAIAAPHPAKLLCVLPAVETSFSAGPGYARAHGGRTGGAGSCASDSSGWRTSSPLPALCCLINRRPSRNVGAHVGCAGLHLTSPLRADIRSLETSQTFLREDRMLAPYELDPDPCRSPKLRKSWPCGKSTTQSLLRATYYEEGILLSAIWRNSR